MDTPFVITPGRRLTLAIGIPLSLALILLVSLDLLARVAPTSTTVNTVSAMHGNSLAVSVDAGDLTFVASPDDRLHVSATAVSSFTTPRLRVSNSPSTTRLSLVCAPLPGPCSLTARVGVPAGARVTATDGSGTIVASGLRGGAGLSTDSGDLQVSDLGGDLSLTSHSGSVDGQGLRSTDTVVNDDSGDISLRFAVAPERVQVNDDSGDISLVVPRRPYQVSAHTDAGTTTITVPTDPSSHNVISARDDSGDIQIEPASR